MQASFLLLVFAQNMPIAQRVSIVAKVFSLSRDNETVRRICMLHITTFFTKTMLEIENDFGFFQER